MKSDTFSLRNRMRSIGFAINGLKILLKEEHNFRIHIVAAVCAILTATILNVPFWEWITLTLIIGIVFILEMINTSIECIADMISPETHPQIKKIKDVAAAGVLTGAIIAFIVGSLIFIPRIYNLLQGC
jgi:diacylglycerol kinase